MTKLCDKPNLLLISISYKVHETRQKIYSAMVSFDGVPGRFAPITRSPRGSIRPGDLFAPGWSAHNLSIWSDM